MAYEDTIRQAVHLAAELSDKEIDTDLALLATPITSKIDTMQQEIDRITAYIAQHGANAPASLMDKLELLDKQITRRINPCPRSRNPICSRMQIVSSVP